MAPEAGARTAPGDGHWEFSVDIYGKPGVAASCLFLQDHYGLDVSLLLVALYYMREREIDLTDTLICEIDQEISLFREHVIWKLRSSRRALKEMSSVSAGEELRESIKKIELRAEQIEQAMIASLLAKVDPEESRPDMYDAAKRVVSCFGAVSAGGRSIDARAEDAIVTIVNAAIDGGE